MAEEDQVESDIIKEIRSKFVGKWQCIGNENFEDFLREMGVPYLMRKMAVRLRPDCDISVVDGKVFIKMISAIRTEEDELNFEEEVEKERMGNKMKVRTSFEDGKIVQHMTPVDESKKPVKGTRQIQDGNLVMTMEIGTVVAKRIFSRAV